MILGRAFLLALLALSACSDWPDLGDPPSAASHTGWPELVPIGQLTADPGGGSAEAAAAGADALAARAAALRARAALLRRPVPDAEAFDALREAVGN